MRTLLFVLLGLTAFARSDAGEHQLSVRGREILLSGEPIKIIGLRCSNALISEETAGTLVRHLDAFKSYGVNAVSVCFMGSRFGDVKGYRPDASLDPACPARMQRIIEEADRQGMVVLVGCLYWSDSRAKEELDPVWKQADANRAVANTVRWLKAHLAVGCGHSLVAGVRAPARRRLTQDRRAIAQSA